MTAMPRPPTGSKYQPERSAEAEAKQKLIAKSPLGVPWIEPEAIAPAVVFLASDECPHGERRDL